MYVICLMRWPDDSLQAIKVHVYADERDAAKRDAVKYIEGKYSPKSVEVVGTDDTPDKGWKLYEKACEKASKNDPAGAGAGQRQGKASA